MEDSIRYIKGIGEKRAKVFAEENNYFDSDAEAFYIQYVHYLSTF